ncbi:hypothetical protein Bca101_002846 [Brassica carinata]
MLHNRQRIESLAADFGIFETLVDHNCRAAALSRKCMATKGTQRSKGNCLNSRISFTVTNKPNNSSAMVEPLNSRKSSLKHDFQALSSCSSSELELLAFLRLTRRSC